MDYSWNSSSPPPPELASFRENAFSGEDFCRILLGFATTTSSSIDIFYLLLSGLKVFIFYVLAGGFIFLDCHFICSPCVSQHGFSKSRKNIQLSSVKPNVEVAKWALKRKRCL